MSGIDFILNLFYKVLCDKVKVCIFRDVLPDKLIGVFNGQLLHPAIYTSVAGHTLFLLIRVFMVYRWAVGPFAPV